MGWPWCIDTRAMDPLMAVTRVLLCVSLFAFTACAEDASTTPDPDSGVSPDASADADVGGDARLGGSDDGGIADGAADAGDPGDAGDACGCLRGDCTETRNEAGEAVFICDCGRRFAGETCGECAEGYTGEDCRACDTGYFGGVADETFCFPDPCVGDPCNAHGTCRVVSDRTGVDVAACTCDSAHVGDTCLECAPGYEGGDCERCATGYSSDGTGCVESACVGTDCGRRGECIDRAGTPVCVCQTGWSGDDCDGCSLGYVLEGGECVPDLCVGVDCGPGSCITPTGPALCDCPSGYTGAACDECASGFTLTTVSGVTACRNVNPVVGFRLTAAYDAADVSSFVTDAMGRVESWYGSPGRLWDVGVPLSQKPRYLLLPPSVEFDGVNDFIGSARPMLRDGDEYTIFIVASWNPASGRQTLLDSQYVVGGQLEAFSVDAVSRSAVRFRHRGFGDETADVVTGYHFDAAAGRQLIMVRRAPFLSGTTLTVSNGTDETTIVSTTTAFGEQQLSSLGRCLYLEGDGDCELDGRFHELLSYEGPLTTGQRAAIAAYLREKWSL